MTTLITVQNLKCGGCATTITSKISKLNNISDVVVNNDSSTVSFTFSNLEDITTVKDNLKVLGYPSLDDKNTVFSKAKSFVSCAKGKI